MSRLHRMRATLLLAGTAIILASCLHAPESSARTDDGASFCTIAKPISYSPKDTRETKIEIWAHNEVGCALWRNGHVACKKFADAGACSVFIDKDSA